MNTLNKIKTNLMKTGTTVRITTTLIIMLILSAVTFGQTNIEYLENVLDGFIEKYKAKNPVFNPLHVGDLWQYTNSESGNTSEQRIIKDTLVNNAKYYYKTYERFYNWERYDTLSLTSYKLDVEDLDNDGFYDDEVLVDTFSIEEYTEYDSYKYSWRESIYNHGAPNKTILKDTFWGIIFDDTVLVKKVEYLDAFLIVDIADGFGKVWSMLEGPPSFLTGAIINSHQFGTIVSVNEDENFQLDFSISQNYPNPFNPSTTIEYTLKESGYVKIVVYDILGSEVETLLSGYKNAGNYRIEFNANKLASGVYFYSMIFNNQVITRQMLLLS